MNNNTEGRQRIFRERGIPDDTLITTDSFKIILTKESMLSIANIISKKLNRKLQQSEAAALKKFLARFPESSCYNKNYSEAKLFLANEFITRHRQFLNSIQEQDFDARLSGVSDDTDSGGIVDYEKKELLQFTQDENSFKFSAHQNRRGNSIIDSERVDGKRSSPDNILPLDAVKNQYAVNKELFDVCKMLQKFLAPSSVENMFNRIQSINTDYNNISLVRQLIQLDSRNRLPVTYNNNEYKWNIHTSGQPGQLGDVRLQDTLQQVIRINAFPFWAPVNPSINNPYEKIRLLLREFSSQSVLVSEFNNPNQSNPTIEPYHFEFEIQDTLADRVYLVPKQTSFKFRKPMAKVETITTQFRTPFQDEIFDPDRGIYTVTFGNPTLFSITSPAVHLLNTNDLVYIYNVSSGSKIIDDEINRPQGQNITKISATDFTIPVNSAAIVGTDTNVDVYYGSKRIFFQLEFLCLEQ